MGQWESNERRPGAHAAAPCGTSRPRASQLLAPGAPARGIHRASVSLAHNYQTMGNQKNRPDHLLASAAARWGPFGARAREARASSVFDVISGRATAASECRLRIAPTTFFRLNAVRRQSALAARLMVCEAVSTGEGALIATQIATQLDGRRRYGTGRWALFPCWNPWFQCH